MIQSLRTYFHDEMRSEVISGISFEVEWLRCFTYFYVNSILNLQWSSLKDARDLHLSQKIFIAILKKWKDLREK